MKGTVKRVAADAVASTNQGNRQTMPPESFWEKKINPAGVMTAATMSVSHT